MTRITADTETYTQVRRELTAATERLRAARGTLDGAVPAMAFGPIGAFVPPVINALGSRFEDASDAAAAVAERASTGSQQALADLTDTEASTRARMQALQDGER